MSDVSMIMSPELYLYLQRHSLREPSILAELREETHKMSMGHMQISPEQGQFMCFLVELMGATHLLELGTFTGYSTLWLALALPEQGRILTCDINTDWTAIAKKYWARAELSEKIELRLGKAAETLDQLLADGKANAFDFVFIDADKVNYLDYYEKSLQLVRSGGLIVIDNVFQEGRVADLACHAPAVQTIRQLNDALLQDDRVSLSMLPIGDGVTLVRKK